MTTARGNSRVIKNKGPGFEGLFLHTLFVRERSEGDVSVAARSESYPLRYLFC